MDYLEKSVDTAVAAVKQQITLATAIIGAVFAFREQLDNGLSDASAPIVTATLGVLGLSVITGVLTLMAVSDALRREVDPLSKRVVRICGSAQNALFVIAVLLMVTMVLIVS